MTKTTTEMQLVSITKLVPYVNNARTHSPEQTLHQIILGRNLPVIGAAVFLHDLEDLVPEPHRLVHVVDTDIDERGRDRLLGSWVLGEESHAVGHLLALNPAGAAHGVTLQ